MRGGRARRPVGVADGAQTRQRRPPMVGARDGTARGPRRPSWGPAARRTQKFQPRSTSREDVSEPRGGGCDARAALGPRGAAPRRKTVVEEVWQATCEIPAKMAYEKADYAPEKCGCGWLAGGVRGAAEASAEEERCLLVEARAAESTVPPP